MMHSMEFENVIKTGTDNNPNHTKNFFADHQTNFKCKYYQRINIYGSQYTIGTYVDVGPNESEMNFGEIIYIIIG